MNAPDLRPKPSDSNAAPMETSQSKQLEHQFHGTLTFPSGAIYRATMRVCEPDTLEDKPSGIGDIHCSVPMPLLAKVLPAGGPLVPTHWTCPTCGLTMRGLQPSVCMDDCNPECQIGGAP